MSSCKTCENRVVAHTCSPRPGNDGGSVSQAQQDRASWAPKVHKNKCFFLTIPWIGNYKLEISHNLYEDLQMITASEIPNSRFYVVCLHFKLKDQTKNWDGSPNLLIHTPERSAALLAQCSKIPASWVPKVNKNWNVGSVSQVQQDRAPWAPKVHKTLMFFPNDSLNRESQTRDFP